MIRQMPKMMLICLFGTIIVETIVALIFGLRKKEDLINVVLVNILTNPIVSSIPFFLNIKYGLLYRNISLYSLEVITVFVEGFIYKKVLVYKKINPYLLSFLLNLISYCAGLILNSIIY